MTIHIFCKPNVILKTIFKLKNTKLFSKIIKLDQQDMLILKTKVPLYDNELERILSIEKKLLGIQTIRSFTFYPLKTGKISKDKAKKLKKAKIMHIFFDIDSTLTHQGISVLNRNVKEMFEKFREQNCSVYFCTGRSLQDVRKLIKMYKTSPYGIAENGGIIINSSLTNEKFGDRTEPDKLLIHMTNKNISYTLDSNQQSRKTEYVIIKESLTKTFLNRAIRESKLKIEVHTSKNTYHISKRGVNKGTAIEYVTSEEELALSSSHEVIAVGDSDLDIPMFKYSDSSYAVGNADSTVKKKATYTLTNSAPKAIEELYNKLFSYA